MIFNKSCYITTLNKKQSNQKFACCPCCGTIVIQGEIVKNAIVKCPNCKHKIIVNISQTNVSTQEHITTNSTENAKQRSFFS